MNNKAYRRVKVYKALSSVNFRYIKYFLNARKDIKTLELIDRQGEKVTIERHKKKYIAHLNYSLLASNSTVLTFYDSNAKHGGILICGNPEDIIGEDTKEYYHQWELPQNEQDAINKVRNWQDV